MLKETFLLDVFVETGTYVGETTNVAASIFDAIHTIELSERLYLAAARRFINDINVSVHHGSSDLVFQGCFLRFMDEFCLLGCTLFRRRHRDGC